MSSPKRILSNFEALCALRVLYPGRLYYNAAIELTDFTGSDEQGIETFKLAIQPGFNCECNVTDKSSWQEAFDDLATQKLAIEINRPPPYLGDLNDE